MIRNMLILASALALVRPIGADASVANHLSVDLISEYKAISPGYVSWIGLRFELEPGWHIYWKDPGDSGEPLSVRWNLPEGVKLGPIHWPAPKRIPDHTLVDYGYERSVLLAAPLRVSHALTPPVPVNITATVSYLVCKDVCIPGTANAGISLPVSRRGSLQPSEWRRLCVQTRSRWPKAVPLGWKVTARATPNRFILALHTGSSERSAVFFPAKPTIIKNAAPQVASALPDGVRLLLEKSDLLLRPPSRLEGVVVLDGKGAFTISAPIHSEMKRGG
jgi:DsbC/DsbD-like thiol-disulfide interchange protein